jgi:hypothetical protein
VSIQKRLFFTISASDSNFNAQNTQCIPALKIRVFLDLAKKLTRYRNHFINAFLSTQIPQVSNFGSSHRKTGDCRSFMQAPVGPIDLLKATPSAAFAKGVS